MCPTLQVSHSDVVGVGLGGVAKRVVPSHSRPGGNSQTSSGVKSLQVERSLNEVIAKSQSIAFTFRQKLISGELSSDPGESSSNEITRGLTTPP